MRMHFFLQSIPKFACFREIAGRAVTSTPWLSFLYGIFLTISNHCGKLILPGISCLNRVASSIIRRTVSSLSDNGSIFWNIIRIFCRSTADYCPDYTSNNDCNGSCNCTGQRSPDCFYCCCCCLNHRKDFCSINHTRSLLQQNVALHYMQHYNI